MVLSAKFVRTVALTGASAASASHAAAQDPLTTRCESAPIAALFKVFGDTGRMSRGLTEAKALLKERKSGDTHPLLDPKGFREQLDALQGGAEYRLLAERAKKAN